MKNIIICLFLLNSSCLYSQNEVNKDELKRVFRESIIDKKDGYLSLPSNVSWKFNNIDSLYYKADTITAIRYRSSKSDKLCEYVDWSFYHSRKFILGKAWYCKEPPLHSVIRIPEDYYTLAIYNVEKDLMIDILRYDKMIIDSFKVLEIKEGKDTVEIKLLRRIYHI